MSEHYYTANPTVVSNRKTIQYYIQNNEYVFYTDTGVFSRKEVDFGTDLLINTIIKEKTEYRKVIDIGCGYGVLGVILAKLNAKCTVYMGDVNKRAVHLAVDNINLNKALNIKVYMSNLFEGFPVIEDVDMIVSNPPIRAGKRIVFELIDNAERRLMSEGSLWMVVQKKQGAPSFLKKLKGVFPIVEIKAKKRGYYIFHARKE